MTKRRKPARTILALILALLLCMGALPTAYAASQEVEYHDPADGWLDTAGRADTFNSNAVVTIGTIYCRYCTAQENGRAAAEPYVYTSAQTFRVPEYTKDGISNAARNIHYSDGTMVGGTGQGNLMYTSPNNGGIYTGYHWTKTMCMKCGRINTNENSTDYCYLQDIYSIYDCAADFDQQTLPETTEWEYLDDTHHYKSVTSGIYCGFCFGTNKSTSTKTESHSMERSIRSELSHDRFIVSNKCSGCTFSKTSYILAKSTATDYEGVADGQPHTIIVSDLSEAGVTTQIRYGYSADSCNLTTAPNYIEPGSYPIYYQITYTYQSTDMVEDGVAYVRLAPKNDDSGNGSCDDGQHTDSLLEAVHPSCKSLGYSRYLCVDCGRIERRDYIDSLGHAWQTIKIRDADCTTDGKELHLCSRCGLAETESTPKGEHEYKSYSVKATCTNPGYTVKECSICGDRHITDLTNSLPHNYKTQVNPAMCERGGNTLHLCEGCGSSFITDYTEPMGHTWNEGQKVTDSACNGEGVTEYRCIRCNYHRLEATSAKGHTPGEPATCTEPQICIVCNAILELPTGHELGEWIVDEEPTAESDGQRHKECENCGEVLETESIERLQQEYHSAYIVGYPNGTFDSERNMSRAEAASVFARLLAEKNGDSLTRSAAVDFTDIPHGAWYSGAVRYLSNYEVIFGRGNKIFAPNAPISRAEFTAMAVRFFSAYGTEDTETQEYKGFSDVSSDSWSAKYIREAATRGWIVGYKDGTFRGENNITRAEAVSIVNQLLGRKADELYISKNIRSINTFPDMVERHWAYWDVLEATNSHDIVYTDTAEAWKRNGK